MRHISGRPAHLVPRLQGREALVRAVSQTSGGLRLPCRHPRGTVWTSCPGAPTTLRSGRICRKSVHGFVPGASLPLGWRTGPLTRAASVYPSRGRRLPGRAPAPTALATSSCVKPSGVIRTGAGRAHARRLSADRADVKGRCDQSRERSSPQRVAALLGTHISFRGAAQV